VRNKVPHSGLEPEKALSPTSLLSRQINFALLVQKRKGAIEDRFKTPGVAWSRKVVPNRQIWRLKIVQKIAKNCDRKIQPELFGTRKSSLFPRANQAPRAQRAQSTRSGRLSGRTRLKVIGSAWFSKFSCRTPIGFLQLNPALSRFRAFRDGGVSQLSSELSSSSILSSK